MLNKCILIGRLTRAPELRYTNEGTPVCNFNLAVERDFANRDGDKETDFIDVVAWRKTGENVAEYLTKGKMVAVTGRLQINKNEGDNGKTYINPEVVAREVKFLDNNLPVDSDLKRNAKKENEQEFNNREPNIDLDDIEEDEIEVPF